MMWLVATAWGAAELHVQTRLIPPRCAPGEVAAITAANRLSITGGRARLTGLLKQNTDVLSGRSF